MKTGFIEYHDETVTLTKDLQEESDERLRMIKLQLNYYLFEIIKLTEKVKVSEGSFIL